MKLNRGQVLVEAFGAGAEQHNLYASRRRRTLANHCEWASGNGKTFLGEDRAHSGVAPSVEVKAQEVAENVGSRRAYWKR